MTESSIPLAVFVNGAFQDDATAMISVFDHAFLYGDGVFETTLVWNGKAFKLEDHLDRMWRSLRYASMVPAYPREELKDLILQTIRRTRLTQAYVKWILTRGRTASPLLDIEGAVPGCVIFVRPFVYLTNQEDIDKGLSLWTSTMRRPPHDVLDSRVKCLNYMNLVIALNEAKAAGADHALMLDTDGRVAEGAGFNIFAVTGDLLLTPGKNILEGITRQTVLDLAPSLNLDTRIGDVYPYDLYNASEVLLTSTAGGIMPATVIDGHTIGTGRPGPVCSRLSKAYLDLLDSGHASVSV